MGKNRPFSDGPSNFARKNIKLTDGFRRIMSAGFGWIMFSFRNKKKLKTVECFKKMFWKNTHFQVSKKYPSYFVRNQKGGPLSNLL